MNDRAGNVLGFALGDGHVAGVLLSRTGTVCAAAAVPFTGGTPTQTVAKMREVKRVLDGGKGAVIAAVGAAIPGHVNHRTGTVVFGQNLERVGASWENVEFAELLENAFSAPAAIDNDVNCMVIARQPVWRERSVVAIYLASELGGLGSGILVDGDIIRGCVGGAGEFGHIVVQPGGPRCSCGNRGCVEAVVGAATLLRNVNWGDRSVAESLTDAARLASEGDETAVATFLQAGRFFGQALSTVVNLLNPPLIVIGGPPEIVSGIEKRGGHRGGRPTSADLFRRGYEATLHEYSFARLDAGCRVKHEALTIDLAAEGAGMVAAAAATAEPSLRR